MATSFGKDTSCTDCLKTGRYVTGLRLVAEVLKSTAALVVGMRTGTIVLSTDYADKMFGCKPGETLEQRNIDDLVPEEFRQRHHDARVVYSESPYSRYKTGLAAQKLDGTRFCVGILLRPIIWGGSEFVLTFVTNMVGHGLLNAEVEG